MTMLTYDFDDGATVIPFPRRERPKPVLAPSLVDFLERPLPDDPDEREREMDIRAIQYRAALKGIL